MIHTTRAVMGDMRRQKYGRIVNVTSIAALGTSLPGNAFYAATKAEAQILTLRFALELGAAGITVNAVAPGFVQTERTRGTDEEAWKAQAQTMGALAMLGRVGEPEDVANAVAFFASPDSGLGDGAGAGGRRRADGLPRAVVGQGWAPAYRSLGRGRLSGCEKRKLISGRSAEVSPFASVDTRSSKLPASTATEATSDRMPGLRRANAKEAS